MIEKPDGVEWSQVVNYFEDCDGEFIYIQQFDEDGEICEEIYLNRNAAIKLAQCLLRDLKPELDE